MTAVLPTTTTSGNLSVYDEVSARPGLLPSATDLPHSMGTYLHLTDTTPVQVRLHRSEKRAVVNVGDARAEVTVFVDLDQVERLAALFAHVRDRLR